MVSFDYPLIKEMKKHYRKAYEETGKMYAARDTIFNDDGVKKVVEEGLKVLVMQRKSIVDILEKIKIATDLPAKERDDYVSFVEQNLKNVDSWISAKWNKTRRLD